MRETDYSQLKSIGGLALLALLVRVIYLQLQGGNPLFATPSLDELYHYQWALDIVRGEWIGDRAFFRAPLYCYLLGIIFSIVGPDLGPGPLFYIATLLQHLGGVAACVLIYILTLKLFNRRGVAFTAMGLAALYAPALFFEGQLLDISLQALLLPLVLLLAIHIVGRHPWRFDAFVLPGMLGESLLWTIPLFVFDHVLQTARLVATVAQDRRAVWFDEVVLSLGAGLYEELVFRLICITALAIVFVDLFKLPRSVAAVAVMILSAGLFAAHHHHPDPGRQDPRRHRPGRQDDPQHHRTHRREDRRRGQRPGERRVC